ncbi:MAG: PQQ-binding-like beta-propeller repeat protein [Prevotellaceae bacterium]|jgi:outer membrane protein assembly factor BamB|nr:PQQ-binding-like beta-propeller repeat protein [Prevotellaceae bacterium]
MKKKICRNIAIVSAIFIATFSIMLITSYFQVRGFDPLQADVVETLKQINDENAGNTKLQEQIRQLDLLARRAYFVRIDHLRAGVYILVAMLVVFVVALRLYFTEEKSLPGKKVDPVDDWMEKTLARKYVAWIAGGLVAVALAFALLSAPFFKGGTTAPAAQPSSAASADAAAPPNDAERDAAPTGAEEEATAATAATAEIAESATANLPEATGENPEAAKGDSAPAKASAEAAAPRAAHSGFRGNNSNAVSPARNVPLKWNPATGENIAWASDIPRQGFSSPVITGNRVFITGADEQARELYCYDLTTGKLLWTLAASNIPGSPSAMPETTEDTGLAASTVATNGRQVCAIFASGDLICADMEGKRLWAKNLGVPQNHYGYASSLLAFGNSLIVQYDNSASPRVMALDMATGAERWVKNRTDKITWSSPIIAYVNNQPQLVLMGNPSITAYNPGSGEQYWRVEGLNGEVASSPCSAAGVVFGASEYAALIAVNAVTGETLWTANDFLPEVSSPVATKDNVFLATSYGVLACYDAKTGELKQSHELNTEFYSSPLIAEGKLYVFSNSGKMFIYSANQSLDLLSSFDTGQKTFATPALTDGKIVVRTEKSIYCAVFN